MFGRQIKRYDEAIKACEQSTRRLRRLNQELDQMDNTPPFTPPPADPPAPPPAHAHANADTHCHAPQPEAASPSPIPAPAAKAGRLLSKGNGKGAPVAGRAAIPARY